MSAWLFLLRPPSGRNDECKSTARLFHAKTRSLEGECPHEPLFEQECFYFGVGRWVLGVRRSDVARASCPCFMGGTPMPLLTSYLLPITSIVSASAICALAAFSARQVSRVRGVAPP